MVSLPPWAGSVNAWAQSEEVAVRRRPSTQALQPGSERSARTTRRPSGPAGTAASAVMASEGSSPTVAPAPSTIRTRCATSAAPITGWFSGLIRHSQPASVWPTATRPGTASIRLAVSWAALSAASSTTKPTPSCSNCPRGSTPWPATMVATTPRSDGVVVAHRFLPWRPDHSAGGGDGGEGVQPRAGAAHEGGREGSVLPCGDDQGPGLFRALGAVDGRRRQGAGLAGLDQPAGAQFPRSGRVGGGAGSGDGVRGAAGGTRSGGGVGCCGGRSGGGRNGLQHVLRGPGGKSGQRTGEQQHHGGDGGAPDQDLAGQGVAAGRGSRRRVGGVEQGLGTEQGRAEQRERRGGDRGTGERGDQDLGAGAGGDVPGQPAACQHQRAGRPEAAGQPGAPAGSVPAREKQCRQGQQQHGQAEQQAQQERPWHGPRPEGGQPGNACAGVEAQRLAQNLLPERSRVEAQRQARISQQGAGPVQNGEGKGKEQGQAGQQRPPDGASAASQQY